MHDRGDRAFAQLARLLSRRARLVLACTGLLVVAGALGGVSVAGRLTGGARGFIGQDRSFQRDFAASLRATGNQPQAAVVALVRPGAPVASPVGRARVAQVVAAMRREPEVVRVVSPLDDRSGATTSRDGRSAYAAAFVGAVPAGAEERATAAIDRSLAGIPGVTVANNDQGYAEIDRQITRDLPRVELIAVPLLLVLSFLVFRGLVAAALPLLIASVAVSVTMLALRGLVEVMPISSFALNLSTGLGLGLAIDDALLIVSRHREELLEHGPGLEALQRTLSTAGRTVVFSALTVGTALLCLLVLPLPGLRSMAVAGALVAFTAAFAALVPATALLALLGERVNSLAPRRLQRSAQRAARPGRRGGWYALAHRVMRRPRLVALGTGAVLLAAGLPALHGHLGLMDARALPPSHPNSAVPQAIDRAFPADAADPTVVLARGARPGPALARYVAQLRRLPEVFSVRVGPRAGDGMRAITVVGRGLPHGPRAQRMVSGILALDAPFAVRVTGSAAVNHAQGERLRARLPLAGALLSVSTFLVLLLMTRSLLLPLKAVLMNVVTATATFGLLVAIFQDGRLASLLDFQPTGFLDQHNLVLLLFLVLGLSTDYGVFLLARIKEAHDHGADNREAVAQGIERSGRIVTAAALLFCVAVGTSVLAQVLVVKEFAVGAAVAVLIDATLVRVLLVPALMALLGEANWWAPRFLRRPAVPATPAVREPAGA